MQLLLMNPMFDLTIPEKIEETRLNFYQRSLIVL